MAIEDSNPSTERTHRIWCATNYTISCVWRDQVNKDIAHAVVDHDERRRGSRAKQIVGASHTWMFFPGDARERRKHSIHRLNADEQ